MQRPFQRGASQSFMYLVHCAVFHNVHFKPLFDARLPAVIEELRVAYKNARGSERVEVEFAFRTL